MRNLLSLLVLLPILAFAANGIMKGSGTEDAPWQIDDYEDLKAIGTGSYFYSNHYVLTADIDASPSKNEMCNEDGCNGFISIGKKKDAADSTVFTGSFDGQNHTIRNMNIWLPCESSVGFISYLAGSFSNVNFDSLSITGRVTESRFVGVIARAFGPVENVHVTNGFVQGEIYVGGIVGSLYEAWGYPDRGSIKNVSFQGTVKGKSNVGGIVGDAEKYVEDAKAYVNIIVYATDVTNIKSEEIGGIAGYAEAGIVNCSAEGTISPDAYYCNYPSVRSVGGLVGELKGSVIESYALVDILGPVHKNDDAMGETCKPFDEYIGGLVGENEGGIVRSYFIGRVEGQRDVGGLVGLNDEGEIENSYAIGNVMGGKIRRWPCWFQWTD